jgi:hypothetical protein
MGPNPLEPFLQNAFENVRPPGGLDHIGSVAIDPNWGEAPRDEDREELVKQLERLLRDAPVPARLSRQGFDIHPDERFPILRRYVNTVTLRGGRLDPWVRVLPPGGSSGRR